MFLKVDLFSEHCLDLFLVVPNLSDFKAAADSNIRNLLWSYTELDLDLTHYGLILIFRSLAFMSWIDTGIPKRIESHKDVLLPDSEEPQYLSGLAVTFTMYLSHGWHYCPCLSDSGVMNTDLYWDKRLEFPLWVSFDLVSGFGRYNKSDGLCGCYCSLWMCGVQMPLIKQFRTTETNFKIYQ